MIYFHSQEVKFPKIEKQKTKNWIKKVISCENKLAGNINIIFCSDDYLLNINKEYLKHNYYTDVITFDYCENTIISGDIFISLDRIKENANEEKTEYQEELKRVIIHGVLHLIGYNDKENDERNEMRMAEDKYLKLS